MKLIVVGFKTTKDNSVYYQKTTIGEDVSKETRKELYGKFLYAADKAGADFVSIRFVREKTPTQELQESLGDVI